MMEFQQEVRLAMQVLLKVLRGSEDVDDRIPIRSKVDRAGATGRC